MISQSCFQKHDSTKSFGSMSFMRNTFIAHNRSWPCWSKLDIFGTLSVEDLGILLLSYHIKFSCHLNQALHTQPRKCHIDKLEQKEIWMELVTREMFLSEFSL